MKDTICAIGTLVGDSSINLVRISGNDSINIVNKIFSRDLTKKQTHTITYGFIFPELSLSQYECLQKSHENKTKDSWVKKKIIQLGK